MTDAHPLIAVLAAGVTVVVPSARVSAAIRAHYDLAMQAGGQHAWPAPKVSSWEPWWRQRLDELHPSDDLTLSALQEQALWQTVIAASDSDLAAPGAWSRLAQDAWATVHAWDLMAPLRAQRDGMPEHRAFIEWSQRFALECRRLGVIDRARVLARAPPASDQAPGIFALGFDDASPALRQWLPPPFPLDHPAPASAAPRYLAFQDGDEEISAAIAWAATARQQAPHGRVAIACAEPSGIAAVAQRVHRRERAAFSALFAPGDFRVIDTPLPPLLRDALTWLEASRTVPRSALAAALTSPYLSGAESARAARARLASRVLQDGVETIDFDTLSALGREEAETGLNAAWLALGEVAAEADRRLPLKHWMSRIDQVLTQLGWPGHLLPVAREQDSFKRWRRALDTVASLDVVLPAQSLAQALGWLREVLNRDHTLAPCTVDAIEILSLEEAITLRPEHLWVLGFHDAAWPPPRTTNPLLPFTLLQQAGIPAASRDAWLQRAQTSLEPVLATTTDLVLSFATYVEQVAQRACVGPGLPLVTEVLSGNAASVAAVILEPRTELAVPWRHASRLRGGAAVLTDQAACPFKAFAHHRLHAASQGSPELGLDPRQRGELVHRVLAALWRDVGTSKACHDLDLTARRARIAAAVDLVLRTESRSRPGLALERERLQGLVFEWLETDLARAPFEVIACETSRSLHLGQLELRLRIDRIDRTADGAHVVIDYKTGADTSKRQWQLPRPDQPQLLAYAIAEPGTQGIAFAQLRSGDCKLIAEPADRFNQANPALDPAQWASTLAGWRMELSDLARAFVTGAAQLDPKAGPTTCQRCDLQVLCRIHELDQADEADDGDE